MFQKIVKWIQDKRKSYTPLQKPIEDHNTYMTENIEQQVDLMYKKVTGELEVRSKSLIPLENTKLGGLSYNVVRQDVYRHTSQYLC